MNLDLSWKNKWLSGGRMNINSCTTLVIFASCMRYFFLIRLESLHRNLSSRNEKTTLGGGFFDGSVSWGTSEPW